MQAQTQAGDDRVTLEMLRAGFRRAQILAAMPLLKKNTADLLALEEKLAQARDYPGAIAARQERQSVEKELSRLEREALLLQARDQSLKSSLLPNRIELPLAQARLSGVARDPETGFLTGWSKPGASATWDLPNLPNGGYEVLLRYTCSPLEGGKVEIAESFYTLQAIIGTTIKGAQDVNIGTLKISNGNGTLSLTALTVVKDNVMKLESVALVPASH